MSVRIDPSLRVHVIDCRFRDFSRGSSLHGSDSLPMGVSIAWGVPIPRGVSVLGSVPWVIWGWSDIAPNYGTDHFAVPFLRYIDVPESNPPSDCLYSPRRSMPDSFYVFVAITV